MKVFDFNIHLTGVNEATTTNPRVETEMDPGDLSANFRAFADDFATLDGANFMLLNPDLVFEHDVRPFLSEVRVKVPDAVFTALLDFRRKDALEGVDQAAEQGFCSVKFHSQLQRIADQDFEACAAVAKRAQERGLMVCVDASFGTVTMYKYDNLKLACYLSEVVKKTPLIVLHSAGLRVLEGMLLAEDSKNVFLETSFSLPYYAGSSVEADFAFAYKKIGAERVLYASDFPALSLDESMAFMLDFWNKHGFSESEQEKMLWGNAARLVGVV